MGFYKLKQNLKDNTSDVNSLSSIESFDKISIDSHSSWKAKVKNFFSIDPEIKAEMEREQRNARLSKHKNSLYDREILSRNSCCKMAVM